MNVPLLLKLPAMFVVPEVAVNVPALTVSPFKVISLAPKLSVPLPIFVSEPVVAGIAPEIVRVFVVTSVDDVVAAVNVNALSVPAVAPVYCNVPPPSTKFVAALVAAPRFPATPPLPIVATLNTPALIVVTPVYKFVPDNVNVPLPIFVSEPVVFVLAPEIVTAPSV